MAAVQAILADSPIKREVKKNSFGAMEIAEYTDSGMVKTVYMPQKELVKDYERQTQIL